MLVRKLLKDLNIILNKHFGFRLLKKTERETIILKKTNISSSKLRNKTSYLHTIKHRETF